MIRDQDNNPVKTYKNTYSIIDKRIKFLVFSFYKKSKTSVKLQLNTEYKMLLTKL